MGIALRETARLNTRRRLIATWYERDSASPLGFSHEVWRLQGQASSIDDTLALLGLLNSALIAYLFNLFSTNNHVGFGDLSRVPIPQPDSGHMGPLAILTRGTLDRRNEFEAQHVRTLNAKSGETGAVSVDPALLLRDSRLPTLSVGDLVRRGDLQCSRPQAKIKDIIGSAAMSFQDGLDSASYLRILALHGDERLEAAMDSITVPDVAVAGEFSLRLNAADTDAQASWNAFAESDAEVDEFVFDWYGIRAAWRSEIAAGLPWAH